MIIMSTMIKIILKIWKTWNMKNTNTFKSKHSSTVYQIKENLTCNSKMVV